jgi:putative membrane protein
MNSLFAFLHHLAAFALVATLVLEFVLVKGPLDAVTARRLTDMLFGVSSGVVLVVGLLSIYPTVVFASWGKLLRQGEVPVVSDEKRRKLRAVMHGELIGVVLILLCAALMARGVGSFG